MPKQSRKSAGCPGYNPHYYAWRRYIQSISFRVLPYLAIGRSFSFWSHTLILFTYVCTRARVRGREREQRGERTGREPLATKIRNLIWATGVAKAAAAAAGTATALGVVSPGRVCGWIYLRACIQQEIQWRNDIGAKAGKRRGGRASGSFPYREVYSRHLRPVLTPRRDETANTR